MTRRVAMSVLAAAVVSAAGCAVGVRYYDAPHDDHHRWDDREERAYRRHLQERHLGYREFKGLERHDQEEYWRWRHDHPDRDDRR